MVRRWRPAHHQYPACARLTGAARRCWIAGVSS